MDIRKLQEGDKIKYIGCTDSQANWGCTDDPRGMLIKGDIYIIDWIDVCDSHTDIYLEKFPSFKFNSVSFEGVERAKSKRMNPTKIKLIKYLRENNFKKDRVDETGDTYYYESKWDNVKSKKFVSVEHLLRLKEPWKYMFFLIVEADREVKELHNK